MKVSIQEGCIGCGLCAGSCPKVFRMGADGTAEVVAPVPDIKEDDVYIAAQNCPVQVITIEEE
ncbi:MAG: ferredoxin [Pygmaiobacter massiliensis]|nr:ferredoxin [Pygmaiobacter massiliensis]